MKYTSTRSHETVSETFALLHGLASDGGLYVPAEFPEQCLSYRDVADKSYEEIALVVLSKLFTTFTEAELETMIRSAYNTVNFDTPDMAPMHSLLERVSVLELFHGRTQAFKDMALSLFPYLLVAAKEAEKETKEVLILTATSGDTGKAALEGFKDVPGTHIQVFFPTDGVSPMQQEQMQKQEGANVNVTAIEGNFDDAQQFLKRLFVDADVAKEVADKGVKFSSANSINIGRLAPQVVYYVAAYAELVNTGAIHEDEAFNVVVPTGNFGNILAAYYAKRMGIPVGKLICASNQNNVLADFFSTGTYDMNRPFYTTISPSMDILESSNFERFIYYVSGENAELTAERMKALKAEGKFSVTPEELQAVQKEFAGAYVDDDMTKAVIEQVYNSYGYVMDPHTAVAMGAYMKELEAHPEDGHRHTVIASTAHPFKFPTPICEALDIKVGITPYESLDNISAVTGVGCPKQLAELQHKPLRFTKVIPKEAMKEEILSFVDTFITVNEKLLAEAQKRLEGRLNLFVKLLGDGMPAAEVTFFRGLIGTIAVLIVMRQKGISFSTEHRGLLTLRGIFGGLGNLSNFIALVYMTMADASILFQLSGIFVLIFSNFVLKEKLPDGSAKWLGLIFLAVVYMIQPWNLSGLHWYSFIAIAGAALSAAAYTTIRTISLKGGHSSYEIMFYFLATTMLVGGIVMIPDFVWPNATQALYLGIIGAISVVAQFFLTGAFVATNAVVAQFMQYVGVFFNSFWGFIVFGENLALATVIAGIIMFSSSVMLARLKEEQAHTR